MISKFKKKLLWISIVAFLSAIIGFTELSNNKTIAKATVKKHTISDEEFKNLVINSYKTVIQIDTLRTGSYFKDTDGLYYSALKKDFTDYNSLYKYFDEELSLSKYFSKDFKNRLIKRITKEINGHYYMLVGDFGIGIKYAKLISQKYEGNKLIVTFQCKFNDGDAVNFNGTIIYDSNWKFDKVDLWGFKFKDN